MLNLTITEGTAPVGDTALSAMLRAKELRCDPPSGDHPYRAEACHDVDVAKGDFNKLPGEPGKVCSGVYKPVSVTALGEWRGIPVRFERTYLNLCKLTASTGVVFDF